MVCRSDNKLVLVILLAASGLCTARSGLYSEESPSSIRIEQCHQGCIKKVSLNSMPVCHIKVIKVSREKWRFSSISGNLNNKVAVNTKFGENQRCGPNFDVKLARSLQIKIKSQVSAQTAKQFLMACFTSSVHTGKLNKFWWNVVSNIIAFWLSPFLSTN